MHDAVVIDRRFRGPPDSANGGYACGLVAARLTPEPAVEVTLRLPPPLDRPLAVEGDGKGARLLDGDALVAEGRPAAAPAAEPPAVASLEEAERARRDSPMQHEHPYPTCFVCGPEREPGDGLRVTCGPVEDRGLVAAPFEATAEMDAGDGSVRHEFVWSALDCPSGIAGMLVPESGVSVLGRLTAQILRPLDAGEVYVAIGWPIAQEGRKQFAGSAIVDREGEPMAVARATWIEVGEQRPENGS